MVMKNEICYRIFRIIFVVFLLVFLSFVRGNVQASYDGAKEIMKDMPEFVVTSIDNDYSLDGLSEKHKVQIKNVTTKSKDVSFMLNDGNGNFPYNYMNYEILKNNVSVKKGKVLSSGSLYKVNLKKNENSVYEIRFWIDHKDVNNLKSNIVSAKLSFV